MAQWTEERRKKHAEMLQRVKPWEKSTGPRTKKGKKRSSANALKEGYHTDAGRALRKGLMLTGESQKQFLQYFVLSEMKNELLKHREKSG